MIRILLPCLLLCALLAGCATPPVDCRIPAPPASLLVVPPPLPPVPADLPARR
jgi:hypothetical protein